MLKKCLKKFEEQTIVKPLPELPALTKIQVTTDGQRTEGIADPCSFIII